MDASQLAHLIKLLDDDSEVVRGGVIKALQAFGPGLAEALESYAPQIGPEGWKVLEPVFAHHKREWLRKVWPDWRLPGEDKARLEMALSLLSQFQAKGFEAVRVPALLESLAQDFRKAHPGDDVLMLAEFLFKEKRLAGAAKNDYYNPFNSNLAFVIEQKRGIPISLACVYILTAARLGFAVEGCNLPGHFLARAENGGRYFYVDCFSGGRLLTEKAVLDLYEGSSADLKSILQMPADAKTIVRRVLSNLSHAYDKLEDAENSRFMTELLRQQHDLAGEVPDFFPDEPGPSDPSS